MTTPVRTFAAAIVAGALVTTAAFQPAAAQPAVSAFLPVANEPPPKLIVDPPIPHRLAAGAVLIPYRTENFRILPVFGPGAVDVSPRAGHLHITVDDLPWHWADASDDQTVVVVGLPPGPHKVLLELALPDPPRHRQPHRDLRGPGDQDRASLGLAPRPFRSPWPGRAGPWRSFFDVSRPAGTRALPGPGGWPSGGRGPRPCGPHRV